MEKIMAYGATKTGRIIHVRNQGKFTYRQEEQRKRYAELNRQGKITISMLPK